MMKGPKAWRVAAILFTLCFVLQGIGALRYLTRLPQDHVGAGLYLVSTVLFAVAAVGFYLRWRWETRQE